MREWFLSTELVEIEGMPSSRQGVSVKANRNNWLKRKAQGKGSAVEYHISNFHENAQKALIELYGSEYEKNHYQETIIDLRKTGGNYRSLEYKKPSLFDSKEPNASAIFEALPVHEADTIDIPEFNVQAAAGAGCLSNTEYQTSVFTVSTALVRSLGLLPEYSAIVFCSGESMLPTMNDGDRILVDTRELTEPVKDGIYVIRIDEMVYVKRLKWNILNQSYRVVSDNPSYEDFEMAGEDLKRLKVIGRAAMVMRSL
ncbi:peptidase [Photobacterium sp. WH77]|uniref:helix-turn-helix domain-containing protein n=1 Tax=unclassified Photobacterium TaxID=2628852 RepID=UPI001EDBB535|nr:MULTISPECIES: S24 family peptidase [unclassified Photobacterium]MCG2836505.1 peptidase [Photobacterium sp. WH77]MCG2844368.1 peptidase [Photobacterium sp. WH80]